MRSTTKKKLFKLIRPIIFYFTSIFFDKKYLHGKYFDEHPNGLFWALRSIIWQKIFGFNRHVPWPVSPFIMIDNPSNLIFDMDDGIINFQTMGCYFSCREGNITIGKNTWIGSNVGIIAQNHDIIDPNKFQNPKDVIIGSDCWIGMNSIILPGVILGNHTVVGAGSVVTKPFPDGMIVLAGNPAKIIKNIEISEKTYN